MTIVDSKVQSSKPYRMKDHVKDIESLGGRVHLKVPPNLYHSPLHSYILSWRYTQQNFLQFRNLLNRNLNGKRLPVQNITERRNIVIRNQNWDTPCVDCLHHSRTRHLVPTGTKTEPALPQHLIVRHTLRKVLLNLHVLVLVFPVFKKNGPNWAVKPTSKEGQEWTLRGRRPTDQTVYGTTLEVNFRQRDILGRLESLRSVSIAQHTYRIISQVRNRTRSLWPLKNNFLILIIFYNH